LKARLVLSALAIAALPTLAAATCFDGHEQAAMSCPEGQVFDTQQQSCITPTG